MTESRPTNSTKPLLVSVVRDESMYRRCIAANPFCADCELLKIDNRTRNEAIPVLYNRVLNGLDGLMPRWIFFAHEDFEPLETMSVRTEALDVKRLYGVIGGRLLPRSRWLLGGIWSGIFCGQVLQSEKDGSDLAPIGNPVPMNTVAETVDCQFLAVHSSLVSRHRLRFDENLCFDLYAEDFCLNALLSCGVETAIWPIKAVHHSPGNIQPRFFSQKAYLDAKYPYTEAFGIVGYTIGGGRTVLRRLQKRVRAFLDRYAKFAVRWYFRFLPNPPTLCDSALEFRSTSSDGVRL